VNLIVFDMDGVLVDPTNSFREATVEVIRHFTGRETTHDRIIEIKLEGGYNNNNDVAVRIIEELGGRASLAEIRAYSQILFWGENRDGTGAISREECLIENGVLEELGENYRLGINTGRGIPGAKHSLDRWFPEIVFDPIMTCDNVERLKPEPDGLLQIMELLPDSKMVYVGDNIDDARCGRAAGVPFIGVAGANAIRRDEIVELFNAEGAVAIVESVNELPVLMETLTVGA